LPQRQTGYLFHLFFLWLSNPEFAKIPGAFAVRTKILTSKAGIRAEAQTANSILSHSCEKIR
jgi:hypothetical protein